MTVFKRICALALACCLALSLGVSALAENADIPKLKPVRSYSQGLFCDVSGWYVSYVAQAYSLGLMEGSLDENGRRCFRPEGEISLAETLTLAARLHNAYQEAPVQFEAASPWYQPYADYARRNGFFPKDAGSFSDAVTRAQFASILSRAVPDSALPPINFVEPGAIPDVDMSQSESFGIYKLYRAGVLTGDSRSFFQPDRTITRSETAVLVSRIVNPQMRKEFKLYAPLYVGFMPDQSNAGKIGITRLVMATEGDSCRLTISFRDQQNCFVSLSDSTRALYCLEATALDPSRKSYTFTFPLETLRKIYEASPDPNREDLILEFYANSAPESATDRFFISLGQFSKYFDAAAPLL